MFHCNLLSAALVTQNLDALDEFKAWLDTIATRNVFFNPDQLATQVLHALGEWAAERDCIRGPSSGTVRTGYLELLRRTCETVELLGLDLKETQNVRLGQVYVPAVVARAQEAPQRDPALPRERRHELLLHRVGEESPCRFNILSWSCRRPSASIGG